MSELNEMPELDESIKQAYKEIEQAELKLKLIELLIKVEEAHSRYTDIINKKKTTVEAST